MDWKVNAEAVWYESGEDEEWESDSGIASGHTCSTPTDSMSPSDSDFSPAGAKLLSSAHSEDDKLWLDGWMDCGGQENLHLYSCADEQCQQQQQQQEEIMMSLFSQHCIAVVKRLAELLLDDDSEIVYKSALYLFDLSRSPANANLVAQSPAILPAVVAAAKRWPIAEYTELGHCLCGLVHYLTQTETGLDLVVQSSECVDLVVAYLHSPLDSILFYAVTALHNLLLSGPAAKEQVRADTAAVERIVSLLQHSGNTKFLAVCTDCLQLLAYSHSGTKLVITQCGGVAAIVRILHDTEYEKLVWTTVRLLKVLSVCHESKQAILASGEIALEALGRCLTSQTTPRLRLNALWTLRNLSDVAVQTVRTSETLLERLILCVDEGGDSGASCVVGILSNLTCRNQHNKTTLVQLGVVSAILRHLSSLTSSPTHSDFLEPALCCLRHVTAGHPLALQASLYLTGEPDRIATLARCIQSSCRLPPAPGVRRVWLGLVRNLVFSLSSATPPPPVPTADAESSVVVSSSRLAHSRRQLVGELSLVQMLADLLAGIVDGLASKETSQIDTPIEQPSDLSLLLDTFSQLIGGLQSWPQASATLSQLTGHNTGLYARIFSLLLDSHSSRPGDNSHRNQATTRPLLLLLQTLAGSNPSTAITLLLTGMGEVQLRQCLVDTANSSCSCQPPICPVVSWVNGLLCSFTVEMDMCRRLEKVASLSTPASRIAHVSEQLL